MIKRILSSFGALSVSCLLFTGAYAADTLTLTIEGQLHPKCDVAYESQDNSEIINLGDITKKGNVSFSMKVDCNAPFDYAIVSQNKSFKYEDSVLVNGGQFQTSVPYKVSTDFYTDGSNFGDHDIPSSSLTDLNSLPCIEANYSSSCIFSNSGTDTAITGKTAIVSINWENANSPLLAGTYSDRLTLIVRAK